MKITTYPSPGLAGEVHFPGDKSLSHRAALFAALAEGESRVDNFQDSGVTHAMLDALTTLGTGWSLEGTRLQLTGMGWKELRAPACPLDCGSSATTLRLLAGALAAAGLPAVLDGSAGLRRRPMGRILQPLRLMGVPVGAQGDTAPLYLEARPQDQRLLGIEYSLPVASAQVKSCLLLAGLDASRALTLHEPGPSRDHTERMLGSMGCEVETSTCPGNHTSTVILHPPHKPLLPLQLTLPGDISSAAFLIAAALIVPGSEVTLKDIGLNPTRTGILDVFQEMGADLTIQLKGEQGGEPYGDITARSSQLSGTQVSGDRVVRMIDEFPVLAVTACFAAGDTQVVDASELRYKESDRIRDLCCELRGLGAKVTEAEDGFTIHGPCPLVGGKVDPHSDHRLAMALAVAGLAGSGPVSIHGAEIAGQSFPGFSDTMERLGAWILVEAGHAA